MSFLQLFPRFAKTIECGTAKLACSRCWWGEVQGLWSSVVHVSMRKSCWPRIVPGCVVCTKQGSAAFSYHPNPHTQPHFSLLFWKGQGDFLQPQEGNPKDKKEVLELLSPCALSQLSCAQIILRFWRRTGMHKSCHSMRRARCCTWKAGSRLWQPGGKETRSLNDYCLLFQIETILERCILQRNLLMFSLDPSEVLLREWNVKHLYLVVCHFLSDSWLHFRNVFPFSELNQFGIL